MNVLFISAEFPYPPTSGGRLRTFNLVDNARRQGTSTFLVAFSVEPVSDEQLADLTKLGIVTHHPATAFGSPTSRWGKLAVTLRAAAKGTTPYVEYFQTARARQDIAKIIRTQAIDLVQIESAYLGPYIGWLAQEFPGLPVVLDAHNVESDLTAQLIQTYPGQLKRWLKARSLARLKKIETAAFTQAATVFVTSKVDKARIAKIFSSKTTTTVIPNGVDTAYFAPLPPVQSGPIQIIFTGQISYGPNEQGILWFAREVYLKLKQQYPSLTWQIVGRNPTAAVELLAQTDTSITVIGNVPDIRPYYRQARLAIVPLFQGGGTRLKVLEAMAMGRPVVSTSIGAEGLGVADGQDILLADSADNFAAAISRLLSEPHLVKRLVRHGQELATGRYSWPEIAKEAMIEYSRLIKKDRP